jgi:hypothetical protein
LISASAAESTTGIISPANASPTGTNVRTKLPSPRGSTRRVPALRPRTRLISATASSRAFCAVAPRSAERAQRDAHAARIHERGRGAGGLLERAPLDAARALGVEHLRGAQPVEEGVEVEEHVLGARAPGVVRVHEIEPQPVAHEGDRRCCEQRRRGVAGEDRHGHPRPTLGSGPGASKVRAGARRTLRARYDACLPSHRPEPHPGIIATGERAMPGGDEPSYTDRRKRRVWANADIGGGNQSRLRARGDDGSRVGAEGRPRGLQQPVARGAQPRG